MSTPKKKPEVTKELLQYLEGVFPLSAYANVTTMEGLYKAHGCQAVIAHLRALYDTQNKR